jgi:hypothetical protein
MFKRSLNKAIIVLVLVVIGAGLTSLGMRLPTLPGLSASVKPKPTPRAVLRNQASTCKGKLNKAAPSPLAVTTQFHRVTMSDPLSTRAAAAKYTVVAHFPVSRCPSRAPPVCS